MRKLLLVVVMAAVAAAGAGTPALADAPPTADDARAVIEQLAGLPASQVPPAAAVTTRLATPAEVASRLASDRSPASVAALRDSGFGGIADVVSSPAYGRLVDALTTKLSGMPANTLVPVATAQGSSAAGIFDIVTDIVNTVGALATATEAALAGVAACAAAGPFAPLCATAVVGGYLIVDGIITYVGVTQVANDGGARPPAPVTDQGNHAIIKLILIDECRVFADFAARHPDYPDSKEDAIAACSAAATY